MRYYYDAGGTLFEEQRNHSTIVPSKLLTNEIYSSILEEVDGTITLISIRYDAAYDEVEMTPLMHICSIILIPDRIELRHHGNLMGSLSYSNYTIDNLLRSLSEANFRL